MQERESYWDYNAPPTPDLEDMPKGVFNGTQEQWESLSPGFRREIFRSYLKNKT